MQALGPVVPSLAVRVRAAVGSLTVPPEPERARVLGQARVPVLQQGRELEPDAPAHQNHYSRTRRTRY